MILVESTATPSANPAWSTVATLGTVDVQPTVTLTGLPSESRATALYCSVTPRAIVSTVRSSVTEATEPLTAVALKTTALAIPCTRASKLC